MKSTVGNEDLDHHLENIKTKLRLMQSPVRLHLCSVFLLPNKYPNVGELYSDFSLSYAFRNHKWTHLFFDAKLFAATIET